MKKINGKEITDSAMAQKVVDGIKIKLIKLLIALPISFIPLPMFTVWHLAKIKILAIAAAVSVIWWLIGFDKIIYLLKLVPKSAKKGWNMGKEFHSFIFACIFWYVFPAAILSYSATFYVILPWSGVIVTFIRSIIDYNTAKKYLAGASESSAELT